ncbi:hypothetical protein [Micromonospora sp. NPDC004704]
MKNAAAWAWAAISGATTNSAYSIATARHCWTEKFIGGEPNETILSHKGLTGQNPTAEAALRPIFFCRQPIRVDSMDFAAG